MDNCSLMLIGGLSFLGGVAVALLSKQRRKNRELGRTGVIPIEKHEIQKTSDQLLNQFQVCETDQRKPPNRVVSSTLTVKNVKTGIKRQLPVRLTPSLPSSRSVRDSNANFIRNRDEILMRVPNTCDEISKWDKGLKSLLAHEGTHASDPAILTSHKTIDPKKAGPYAYVNTPSELKAFLNQTYHEITEPSFLRRAAVLKRKESFISPSDLLLESSEYSVVVPHLSSKNRKKFLQMAARVWETI